ncbi:hypothetical protein BpHYR1_001470 [Brachionus plicatilis]|uniref:Uncharacterized protein n=1 Tax=Brachionus plicatilis TaxID=10195 RepID=A0A3M7PS99_BRAPC|nr:hypothetical protein BpHYR1_001470 [Brachionus plicatilis]
MLRNQEKYFVFYFYSKLNSSRQLYGFQHRLIIKLELIIFIYLKKPGVASSTEKSAYCNESLNKLYNLRNSNKLYTLGSLGFDSFDKEKIIIN